MHEVLVNHLGGLSLPRKSVVRLTDRPDMTLDVYRGRKTTKQQQQATLLLFLHAPLCITVSSERVTGCIDRKNACGLPVRKYRELLLSV